MPAVLIKIHEKENPDPAIPEVKEFKTLTLQTLVILERGMTSGKTSIGIHLVDEHGNHYIAETSAAIMDGFSGALIGAEIRFAEKRAKKN